MWEYEIVEETNIKKLVGKLDEYGAKNWEAVGYTGVMATMKGHHYVLLKRKKE